MAQAQKIQSVRGMNDLLPEQINVWHRVESVLREVGWAYGYQEIRTPIVEKLELFTQSIGDQTDIVQKEMYSFTDSGDDVIALRPEATASAVRACIQHGLLHNAQQRLWYLGPMFRRERPQKGRYRQFHQFGVEAFGWDGPDIDAEVIRLSARIWQRLGVDVQLQINTLGSEQSRQKYGQALKKYFSSHSDRLDPDSVRRLDTNPLRILDSKVDATIEVIAGAPDIREYVDEKTRDHFDSLCKSLEQSDLKYTINPRLVRGLDYYTGTVFEWVTDKLGAQNAVCAGGRYDQLVEKRGGKAAAGVGFAIGLERLIELVNEQDQAKANPDADSMPLTDIYVAFEEESADSHAEVVAISERLRNAGFRVVTHCGGGKLKNQMKRADASGARLAVIAGLAQADTIQVKQLRADRAQQLNKPINLNLDSLVDWCQNNL